MNTHRFTFVRPVVEADLDFTDQVGHEGGGEFLELQFPGSQFLGVALDHFKRVARIEEISICWAAVNQSLFFKFAFFQINREIYLPLDLFMLIL